MQCAHVMAMAVQKLYPDAKVTIGPWIDNGFYYDFDMEPLTDKDLKRIKKEMVSKVNSLDLNYFKFLYLRSRLTMPWKLCLGYTLRIFFLKLFVGSNYWQEFTPYKRRSFKR